MTRTTERVSVLHILLLSKQFKYNLVRPRVLAGRCWNLFLSITYYPHMKLSLRNYFLFNLR